MCFNRTPAAVVVRPREGAKRAIAIGPLLEGLAQLPVASCRRHVFVDSLTELARGTGDFLVNCEP